MTEPTNQPDDASERFEREFAEWLAEMGRQNEASAESERITAEDLAIIVY